MYIADSAGTIQGIARRSRLFEWKLERREGKPTKANLSKDGDAKPPGLKSLYRRYGGRATEETSPRPWHSLDAKHVQG